MHHLIQSNIVPSHLLRNLDFNSLNFYCFIVDFFWRYLNRMIAQFQKISTHRRTTIDDASKIFLIFLEFWRKSRDHWLSCLTQIQKNFLTRRIQMPLILISQCHCLHSRRVSEWELPLAELSECYCWVPSLLKSRLFHSFFNFHNFSFSTLQLVILHYPAKGLTRFHRWAKVDWQWKLHVLYFIFVFAKRGEDLTKILSLGHRTHR